MSLKRTVIAVMIPAVLLLLPLSARTRAQVGQGIMDVNGMTEAQLTALPGMTPALVKGVMEKRPFENVKALDDYLKSQGMTAEQTAAIYETAFIHLNLNTATGPEILLVPKIARRMTREFEEYRPWRTWEQFDREIGKYVGAEETNRLKKYVFIPIDLNTASDETIMTIPGMTPRMLREFKEYRPWKTKEQFDREIGKYVGPAETARLWRFVVIGG
ncbi:MAG: hypothetical protein R2752_20390 [Vicinamibacterales bacterium]